MKTRRLTGVLFLMFCAVGSVLSGQTAFEIAPIVRGESLGFGWSPVVASDRHNFLVVWTEATEGDAVLYGMRVSFDGRLLDDAAFVIGTDCSPASDASVVWNGTEYAVVWAGREGGIRMSLISPAGVISSRGVVVHGQFREPRLAWNGAAYLLVATEWGGFPNTVRGWLVERNGSLGEPVTLSGQAAQHGASAVAASGASFAVLTRSSLGRIEAALLDASGSILERRNLGTGSASPMAIAAGGTAFLAIWSGESSGLEGAVLSDGGTNSITFPQSGDRRDPAISWARSQWTVASVSSSDDAIRLYGVTPAGSVERVSDALAEGRPQAGPGLSWQGVFHLAAWAESTGLSRRVIRARLVDEQLRVQGPALLVSKHVLDVRALSSASGGGVVVTAWIEPRSDGTAQVMARRFTPQGDPLDTPAMAVSQDRSLARATAVDYNGSEFLVVWIDGEDPAWVLGRRISVDGEILETSQPIVVAAPGPVSLDRAPLALSCNTANCVVAWPGSDQVIRDVLVSRTGTVRDSSPRTVWISANPVHDVSIDTANGPFLMVWAEEQPCPFECPPVSQDVYAVSLSLQGAVRGSPDLLSTSGAASHPVLTWGGGTELMVAWNEAVGVATRRISSTGTPLSSPVAAPWIPGIVRSIIWTGSEYRLVSVEEQGAWGPMILTRFTPGGTVRGVQVPVLESRDASVDPEVRMLAPEGEDPWLLWRQTLNQAPWYGATRAFAQTPASLDSNRIVDLSATWADGQPVNPGAPLTVVASVTRAEWEDLDGAVVSLRSQLPLLDVESEQAECALNQDGYSAQCLTHPLARGEVASFTLRLDSSNPGQWTTTVSAYGSSVDPDPANNQAVIVTDVRDQPVRRRRPVHNP